MLPLETGDVVDPEFQAAYQPGVPAASPMVDLDSETDSNHDTALTLACAGGHEDLVALLLERGSQIGKST